MSQPPRRFYSSNRTLPRTPLTQATQEPLTPYKFQTFDDFPPEQIPLRILPNQFIKKEIVLTNEQKLKQQGLVIKDKHTVSAPFKVLLEWAITPENIELDFQKKFLLNYQSYCKPNEMFEFIKEIASEIELTGNDEKDKNSKQKWTKITIFLKTWSELSPLDFHQPDVYKEVLAFIEAHEKEFPGIKPIKRYVENARTKKKGSTFERTPNSNTTEKCKPLREMTVDEVVDQLSLFEYNCFSGITPNDFLGSGWTKKDRYERCPRLMEFMDHFNAVTNWVCSSILEEADDKSRAKLIEKCIEITDKMKQRANFTGFFEFYSGLNSSSISRLSRTWDLCDVKLRKLYDQFNIVALPTKSYQNYRKVLKENATNNNLIPFMGVIIQDLTFIDEGNPNELEKGIVNFEKCRMMAEQLLELIKYQNAGHSSIKIAPFFKDFIETIDKHKDDDDKKLYDISLKIQPRASLTQSMVF